MLKRQVMISILNVEGGAVRLLKDMETDTYSIGLRTNKGMEYKMISNELYELLVKELGAK